MQGDIVVTGLGAITPIGEDVPQTWAGLLDGYSGAKRLNNSRIEELRLPTQIGAPLTVDPSERLARSEARRLDRCQQVAVIAARQAWAEAVSGTDDVDPQRVGAVVGTGVGGMQTLLEQYDFINDSGMRKVSPLTVPKLMPNGPAAQVGLAIGAKGGVHAPVSACASGAEAIAWAYRMLRADEVDIVVAGGAESCLTPMALAGFAKARTLSTRNDRPETASRPWDIDRDGFVLGEGAGMLVLERGSHARARGARAYAKLGGVGTSADAYHITAPDPDADGQSRAIVAAVQSAGLKPTDVGHVNAHATSTVIGDVPEAMAVRTALGDHPVLTGPKGSLGHLLGAAGAVEAIATILTLHHGVIPPTANLDVIDPATKLDVVVDNPRPTKLDSAISNSFGFGGHNVSLAFARI